jgi:hypothetical protein
LKIEDFYHEDFYHKGHEGTRRIFYSFSFEERMGHGGLWTVDGGWLGRWVRGGFHGFWPFLTAKAPGYGKRVGFFVLLDG